MKDFSLNIKVLISSIVENKELIISISKRNIIGKYRGSILGLVWSFFNPLILLSVYTFAFSVVFKAKWGMKDEGHFDFAIILFCSLIIYNLFADVVRESPNLILNNPNFVKKVIFPIELLPIISMVGSLFHALISILVFFIFYFIANSNIVWTAIFFPLVLVPLVLITIGISFFLAALGVYIRDIGHMIGHLLTILMFVSPIFFSLDKLPIAFQKFSYLNPIAYIIEESRNVLIFQKIPQWGLLAFFTLLGLISLQLGFFWFQKTRKGFADVL